MTYEGGWTPVKTDGKHKLSRAGARRGSYELAVRAVHALTCRLYTMSW